MKHIATLAALPAFALGTTLAASAAAAPAIAVPRLGTDMHDAGRARPTAPMTLTFALNYQHAADLEPLVETQADPASPAYHRFLSRAQFDNYFSPRVEDAAKTVALLRADGFTNVTVSQNRLLVKGTAPVATIERLFGTQIHAVSQAGTTRLANAVAAHVPAALQSLVASVSLNNLINIHADHVLANGTHAIKPNLALPGNLFGPDGGYGPLAFTTAYDFPIKKTTGRGQSVGVVIDADYLNSDLASYLEYFGIARTGAPTTRVLVDGGPPQNVLIGDSAETTLDVETITSLAPGVDLYVYEIPSLSDQDIVDAYNAVVTADQVGPVDSSFGGCEVGDSFFTGTTDSIAAQGAALGITFHASSGDGGAFTCGQAAAVSAPASDPHFLAVGGTSLFLDPTTGKFQQELAWSGSGGGVSVVWPLPSYQKGVTPFTSGRNVPDIALDADPSTGESWFIAGAFQGPIGGTSLASPTFGAGLALANSLANSEAGFVNPNIYKAFAAKGYKGGIFRDITSGSNGYYTAGKGYDDVTGIGAILFSKSTSTLK